MDEMLSAFWRKIQKEYKKIVIDSPTEMIEIWKLRKACVDTSPISKEEFDNLFWLLLDIDRLMNKIQLYRGKSPDQRDEFLIRELPNGEKVYYYYVRIQVDCSSKESYL